MKTLFFSLLLIGSSFLSVSVPMAAELSATELKHEILQTHHDIITMTQMIQSSNLDPAELAGIQEDIFFAQAALMSLLEDYTALTGTTFTLTTPLPKNNKNKFTTTYVDRQSKQKLARLNESAKLRARLQSNIDEEQIRLAELKHLLTLPEYQDTTSLYTQALLNKINESIAIINYNKDCLVNLMYPNRSNESLRNEAQQNCLGPVGLVLHRDGYFHVPKLIRHAKSP